MKDGEKADFGAEMFGIGGYGAQRFRRGAEENAVDQACGLGDSQPGRVADSQDRAMFAALHAAEKL